MSAQSQILNPTSWPSEELDRLAFAISARIKAGDELMTKQEAADFLKVKYKTFERRLASKHYPASIMHRDGGTLLFIKSEIIKYVKEL